jgi:mono/diheme cytochrome c family protein
MIMKNLIKLLFLLIICSGTALAAESTWKVPAEDKAVLSIRMFDEDMSAEGETIYENACMSCHGTPTKADFMLMSPAPGDPAGETIQNRTDGEIFYKIHEGNGGMPSFQDVFSDTEIWSIIAYFRSFNEKYDQPKPDLTGIYIPELEVSVIFDRNLDKLKISVTDKGIPVDSAEVSPYVKAMFGNHLLGKVLTNTDGVAYAQFDPELPGDKEGFVTIIAKVSKGYGYSKVVQKMQIARPHVAVSAIAGRHLWSTDAMAPIWIKFTFFIVVFGVWAVLIYIVFGLMRLRKQV